MDDENTRVLVYNYDRTEKFFLNAEVAQWNPREDRPMVPAHATLVAPPRMPWPDGQIPVFNDETWDLQIDNFWRPKSLEVNYNARRPLTTWEPKAISFRDFPPYPDLHRLAASVLVVNRLIDNIRFIDASFQRLVNLHWLFRSGVSAMTDDTVGGTTLCGKPTPFGIYKFESEALVFQMRHCLDTLCRLTELLVDADRVNEAKSFRCDKVGSLFSSQKKSMVANIVRGLGKEFEADNTDFLRISSDLFNAMKHTHMNAETQNLHGEQSPTIVAYHAPSGQHRDVIIYHNHSAHHLMMGFQDTIDRILRNQRAFLDAQ